MNKWNFKKLFEEKTIQVWTSNIPLSVKKNEVTNILN